MVRKPSESGQGLLEYGLIIVLVAVVVILLLAVFGNAVDNLYQTIVTNF